MKTYFSTWAVKLKEYYGINEICGHHFYGKILNSNPIVIDLGANHGMFSERILKYFKCICHAIEVSPKICEQIPDLPGLNKHHCMIGFDEGEVDFYIRNDSESSSAISLQPSTEKPTRVRQTTLTNFMKSNHVEFVDLLKIDIEGSEIDLFRSMSDDMFQVIKQITIEYHDFLSYLAIEDDTKKIRARLIKLGYREYLFSPWFHMDCLYIHPKLCKLPWSAWLFLRCCDIVTRLRKKRLQFLVKLGLKKIK